jgi:hypothetical protein
MRRETMDTDTVLYLRQLEAILVCDQSDGYLKKWAQDKREEIQNQIKLTPQPPKILVAVK